MMVEPEGCIDIPKLLDETKDAREHKPIDIYLEFCHQYCKTNLTAVKKRLDQYNWKPTDFGNRSLNAAISN